MNEERDQTLNQLLTELDGFEGREGVLLLAATNRAEVGPKAMTYNHVETCTPSLHSCQPSRLCSLRHLCVLSFPCASHLCVLSAPLPVTSAVQLQGVCVLSLPLATDLHCEG